MEREDEGLYYDYRRDGGIKQGQTLLLYRDGTRELTPTAELYPEEKNAASGGDYWHETDQIFFTGGHGYGVSPNGDNIVLGYEPEILAYLDGGPFPHNIGLIEQAELIRIKTIKEQLDYERTKGTVKPLSTRKFGAIKTRNQRIRLNDFTKHRTSDIKRIKVHRRLPGGIS